MRILVTLLISSALCFLSCKQTKIIEPKPTTVEVSTPSPFVTMKKTPCYGTCPSYELSILSDGTVNYNGKRFVDNIGIYTGKLTEQEVSSIQEKAKAINFFGLEDKYDSNATDFPTCTINVIVEEQSKTIIDRVGGPKELKELEKLIQELVFNTALTKVDK